MDIKRQRIGCRSQREVEQPDGTTAKQAEQKTATYVPWDEAVASSLAGASLRRTSKLYPVLRGANARAAEAAEAGGLCCFAACVPFLLFS